jgi:hypothetical protein
MHFTYAIDLDYVALKTELTAAQGTIVDYSVSTKSEICQTGKVGLDKIDISHSNP